MKSKIQFINQANNKVKEIIIQNTRKKEDVLAYAVTYKNHML